MQFIGMNQATDRQLHQCALLLNDAFPLAWKDVRLARMEVESFRTSGRSAILAVVNHDVVGWIGAIQQTETLLELHPLVVHRDHRRKGIGTALVQQLEAEAHRAAISTIYLGTDDDFGGTSLFGEDLYPNVLDHLLHLQPVSEHPYLFFQAMGYSVVGVIPDASGLGKHDILMAKRIR